MLRTAFFMILVLTVGIGAAQSQQSPVPEAKPAAPAASSQQPPAKEQPKGAGGGNQQPQTQQQTPAPAPAPATIPVTVSGSLDVAADTKQKCCNQSQQGADKSFWDFTLTDLLLSIFTFFLVVTGVLQWNALRNQVSKFTISINDAKAAFTQQAADMEASIATADRSAKASEEATRFARDEFISTHRPEIIVHSVSLPMDFSSFGSAQGDMKVGAGIIYFNKGTTDAKIVDIKARITRSRFPLQAGIVIHEKIPIRAEKIKGGGKDYIRIKSDLSLAQEKSVQHGGDASNGAAFCMGIIVYEDDRGVKRETGFCRRLDAVAERWIGADSPEYEYAY